MSAEVETMMYAGDTPWHGFGTYVGDEPVLSPEVLRLSGLDWGVEKRPLFTPSYDDDGGQLVDSLSEVASHKSIVRTSDNSVLGIVGKGYTPMQNQESLSFMDSLADEGLIRYHTAGSLRDGKRIWLLAKVDSYDVLAGDQMDEYMLLYNSHDGSGALRIIWTKVRVVCSNTAALALGGARGQGVYLRHTKNIKTRVEEARGVLGIAKNQFTEDREISRMLAKYNMSSSQVDGFLDAIIPLPVDEETNATRAKNQRSRIVELFEGGIGMDIPGVAGTAFAAQQAVIEYANFHRTTRGGQERRFESAMFGTGHDLVVKSTQHLIQMAA